MGRLSCGVVQAGPTEAQRPVWQVGGEPVGIRGLIGEGGGRVCRDGRTQLRRKPEIAMRNSTTVLVYVVWDKTPGLRFSPSNSRTA